MRDPAHAGLAQVLEEPVGRPPHVQDHRQAVAPRQRELLAIEKFLARGVQAGDEIVQADLAHGHQPGVVPRIGQRAVQQLEVILAGAACAQWMDAQCIAVAMAVGQVPHRREVAGLHRRHHAVHHARIRSAGANVGNIAGELRRIEVAVRINPHQADDAR